MPICQRFDALVRTSKKPLRKTLNAVCSPLGAPNRAKTSRILCVMVSS